MQWNYIVAVVAVSFLGSQSVFAGNNDRKDDHNGLEYDEQAEYMGLNLDDLLQIKVSVASGKQESIEEAPGIISVITFRELEQGGIQTVAEALELIPGLYRMDDHISPNFSVRGVSGGLTSYSSVMRVMIDGIPVGNKFSHGNFLGYEIIPISVVDRIEIVRGPASALYGANAFLGAINIVTKIFPEGFKGELYLHSGFAKHQSMSLSGQAVTGYAEKKLSYWLAVSGAKLDKSGLFVPESSPDYNYYVNNTNDASRDAFNEPLSLYTQLKIKPDANREFWASLHYQEVDSNGEFFFVYPLSHQSRINFYALSINGHYRHNIIKNFMELEATLSYGQSNTMDRYRIEVGSEYLYTRPKWAYRGLFTSIKSTIKLRENTQIQPGIDFETYDHDLFSLLWIVKPGTPGYGNQDFENYGNKNLHNLGAYIQGKHVIEHWGSLTAGVRFDYHSQYGSELTWRLAGVLTRYAPFYAKALIGTSFMAPSAYELFAVPIVPDGFVGSDDLEAQRALTTELQGGVKLPFGLDASATVFFNRIKDKVEFINVGGNLTASNVSRLNTIGTDLELKWLYNNLFIAASISLQRTSPHYDGDEILLQALFDQIGNTYVMHPAAMFCVEANYSMPQWYSNVNVRLKRVNRRKASQSNITLNGDVYYLDPYTMLNITISTQGIRIYNNKETRFSISLQNALNRDAISPGFFGIDFPSLPTTFWVGIKHEL